MSLAYRFLDIHAFHPLSSSLGSLLVRFDQNLTQKGGSKYVGHFLQKWLNFILPFPIVVRFNKEPDGLDTFNMLGNIYPLVFRPNGDGQASVNHHALVSQWDVSSITLKPSKSNQ
jgi:hypothetical protein